MSAQPLSPKDKIVKSIGYAQADFGDGYWLDRNRDGTRRIDRDAGSLINHVRKLIPFKILREDPQILDIGAGPGRMVDDFRKAGFQTEGCEYSKSGLQLARARFGIELKRCDLRERGGISFFADSFDFAYCTGVLTMIPEKDLPTAFGEINRVLKPGGLLHVNLLNPTPVDHEPHLTSLPYWEWRRLLIEAGFEDVTSLWPPQREGIGVNNEFCGLFMKVKS